ncbi:response regulator [Acidisarcina polymorpha]|uniref:response regulator n=1 Tax=Acidisarcina polymorpha TaxID=2211140 RepID=UPI001374EE7C|nr:response regulator [Acidisarcina polymorpha]
MKWNAFNAVGSGELGMLVQSGTRTSHRILCVDDEVVATTLRAEILREHGYSVSLFHCPFKALESDLSAVDLALLDFHMPGMNGRELLLRMRAFGVPYPILLLTGCLELLSYEDRVLFSRCLDKGKPVQDLLDSIWKFLDPDETPDWGCRK